MIKQLLIALLLFSIPAWADTAPRLKRYPELYGWSGSTAPDLTSAGTVTGTDASFTNLVSCGSLTTDSGGNLVCSATPGGSGTVTAISQGTNMSFSVDPITTTGTINLTASPSVTNLTASGTVTGAVVSTTSALQVGSDYITDITGTNLSIVNGALTAAGGGGNSFETIAVPAGASVVADSSTDTLTITETSFLTITGTAATDTIDITQVTTDLGTDGLIAANAVALTTDTTGNYAAGDAEAGAALTGDTATAFFASGTLEHERGGLEADVSAYDGLIGITGGAAYNQTGTTTQIIIFDGAGAPTSAALSGDATMSNTGVVTVVDDLHAHTTTSLSGIDIGDDTNLAAGRSLTLSGDSVEADVELYTSTLCYRLPYPTAADDDKSIWINDTANQFTITRLWAESDQTVTLMGQIDDGSPADIDGADLAPAAGTAADTSLNGDVTVAAGDRIDLDIASVANSPTWVTLCWTGTWDD